MAKTTAKKKELRPLVVAGLFQKRSFNHPENGLTYLDKDPIELKPEHLVEEEYVETFNENSMFGKIYIINEEKTEEVTGKLEK